MRRSLLALSLALVVPTTAEAARLQLVLSGPGEPYASTAAVLVQRLEQQGHTVQQVAVDDWRSDPAAALVVALGTRATRTALHAQQRRPVLAALLPRNAWEGALVDAEPGPATALWLDQPFERQLRLLRLVAPNARQVGALLGPDTVDGRSELERAARTVGLALRLRLVEPGADPALALGALLDEVDAMLAVPEPAVWNRVSVQPLLLATFRAGRPVVGFSSAYVRAGAVAAIHSPSGQIAEELAALVASIDLAADRMLLPPPAYPSRFDVTFNPDVARALGLAPMDPDSLNARLRAAEARR